MPYVICGCFSPCRGGHVVRHYSIQKDMLSDRKNMIQLKTKIILYLSVLKKVFLWKPDCKSF